MSDTRFSIDKRTADMLQGLQGVFGVTSNAEVIRSAIGLAKAAARHGSGTKSIVMRGTGEAEDQAEIFALDR